MATVQEIFAQDRALFGTVPNVSKGYVCPHCVGPVTGHTQCFGCLRLFVLGGVPEVLRGKVVPMTTVLDPSGWYSRLWTYKRLRHEYMPTLAALAWTYLMAQRERLNDLLGGEPDVITFVPSTRGETEQGQRFQKALCLVTKMRPLLKSTLAHVPGATIAHNEYKPSIFNAGEVSVDGARVLLLEDTWISGSRAVSAAGALLERGANSVVIVPLARKYDASSDEAYRNDAGQTYDPEAWPR